MPVKDRNPFGQEVEVGKADAGASNPFDRSPIQCPVCQEKDPAKIGTQVTPSQTLRICNVCGNKWSCGNVGGAVMVPLAEVPEELKRPPSEAEIDNEIPEDFRLSGTDRWFGDD